MNFRRGGHLHSGYFSLPVAGGKRTSEFGDVREYVLADGTKLTSVHRGIDFGLPPGEPVFACGSGEVVMAEPRIMSGNTAVIEHLPGLYSLYYHLDRLDVATGEIVSQGQMIGTVGSTGLVTGAHLHWEVRTGGVAVDPEAFTRSDIVDMERLKSLH
jgi:murein DD-endopeptidase MepM/ murein hydrolase activator NlpD